MIKIPRATRSQGPIYIEQNPLTGTYRRNYEGDYNCTEQERVRLQQIAEPASLNRWLLSEKTQQPILELYITDGLTSKELGQLLNRNSAGLSSHFLTPMVSQSTLKLRYPDTPNYHNQAHQAVTKTDLSNFPS
jgi:hypothetical protein